MSKKIHKKTFNLTEEEFRQLKLNASLAGMTASQFILMRLDGYTPKPVMREELAEILEGLAEMSNTIRMLADMSRENGLAEKLGMDKMVDEIDQLALELRETICIPGYDEMIHGRM